MGCGGSKDVMSKSTKASAQKALVKRIEESAMRKQEESAKRKQEEKAKVDQQFNIEPAPGFNELTVASRDSVVGEATERENAPRLAKQASAAMVTRQQKTNKTKGAHHLRNVFFAPLSPEKVSTFVAPRFSKTEAETHFIRSSLKKNFVFTNLAPRQMSTILEAFERVEFSKGEEVIKQGDEGDYFYVINRGNLRYEIDGAVVGQAKAGQSFGELSLLYTCPRSASVIAESNCILYRVDQQVFRYIMQTQKEQAEKDKRELLEGVPFLKNLDPSDLERLADAMVPRQFTAGEYLARKGEAADTLFVIKEGKLRVLDFDQGQSTFEDFDLGPGEHFGERVLLKDEPRPANYIAKTNGMALAIDKNSFCTTMGNFSKLICKAQDKKILSAISLIKNSYLTGAALATLAAEIVDNDHPPQTVIINEDLPTPAALYLVREGRVELKREDGRINRVIEEGGYFGEETLTADLHAVKEIPEVISKYTAVTLNKATTLGVLTLEDCRKVIDTTMIGQNRRIDFTSIVDSDITLRSLTRHTMLGAGTFGQVWLTSKVAPDGTNRPYALKIMSKYELLKKRQALGAVKERNLMAQLIHPFIIRMVQTFQDDSCVYMLLALVQGGELYSIMHPKDRDDGISEKDAKFYGSCILEGLSYMHRRQIVYRDLKPENVLISFEGYPVIVDLGFAKCITSKTYTLCGTPLYLAPEVLLNQGHDKGADHWSLGIMLYEMLAGDTPFYEEGINQITLYRFIVSGAYTFPGGGLMSGELKDLIKRILVTDPRKRLGSLAGGIEEIFAHPWFLDIDFAALRRKEVQAPWMPEIKDPLDCSKFSKWDHLKDKTKNAYPKLDARDQQVFEVF